MNRYILLVILIFVLVLAVLFFTNPEFLDKVWMWFVGFAGYIVLMFQKIGDGIKSIFAPSGPKEKGSPKESDDKGLIYYPPTDNKWEEKVKELEEKLERQAGMAFKSHMVNVFRYRDDGKTTLGLLYLGGKFFCYTLEDTHQDEKIAGETRIPSGVYELKLNRQNTPLTERYRNRFNWFKYHIELQNVPNYSNVYIHIGNTHVDTRGCLLIADGLSDTDQNRMILQSALAFERFYNTLYPRLHLDEPLSIAIWDEDWVDISQAVPKKHQETLST